MPKFMDKIEFASSSPESSTNIIWNTISKIPVSVEIQTDNSSLIYFTYNTDNMNLSYGLSHIPDAALRAQFLSADILNNYNLYNSKGTIRLNCSGRSKEGKIPAALVVFRSSTNDKTYLTLQFTDKSNETQFSISSCKITFNR